MQEQNLIQDMLVSGAKGGKAGGGEARVAQEAPNTLQSKSTLRVVECLGEGEILGLVSAAKSIDFDDTALQNADDSYNFEGVKWTLRNGTPDQAHIEGFPAVEDEVPVAIQVLQPTPIVRTVNDADTDAIRLTMRVPVLTNQDTTNGDLNGSEVSFKCEVQANGGSYVEVISAEQGTITGKTVSPYERQYRFPLTGNPPWNIRVTRVTPDSAASNIQNDIYWSSYTRILDQKLIYPDMALLGLEVDSSLFGSNVPNRAYEIYGIKLQVPSNYNPTTREYTGVWDGTFQRLWSDNPAWVLYDLITNNRYGLGDYIDSAEVDKFGLYTIAQYCDELVPDGKGGMEPRFTFNYVIENQEDALKVLQIVATSFRGMLYWGAEGSSGVVTAVNDCPQDAIKIFSPANVIGGLFTYSSTAAEAHHSAAYVTWNDATQRYSAAIEVVESPALLDMKTYRKLDVVAYGCTSRGQAHRFGKWILDSELNEDESVLFSVGLADADLRPGQIVKVSDPDYADARWGGRLLSATTTVLTLDDAVELEVGETYSIDVVLPDGSLETRPITTGAGITNTLTVSPAFSQTPDGMTMWAITATNLAPRQFRVLGVKETNPVQYEVVAQLYDPTKYARVEQDINLDTTPFTKISSGIITPPSNLSFTEYLFKSGVLAQSAAAVAWLPSRDGRVVRYELEAKRPGGNNNYELMKSTNGVSYSILGTTDGLWSFRVRAFDAMGNASAYVELVDQNLVINGLAPQNVNNFAINNLNNTSILTWDPVTNLNLDHYEIRYSSDLLTPSWNASISVIDKVSADTTSITVASRTGTFMIKAVTVPTVTYPQGVFSPDATLISTDIDFLTGFNFVETLVEDSAFAGTRIDVTETGGNLELVETMGVFASYGEYYHHDIIDLGAVYTSRVTPNIVATGRLSTNDVDGWVDVDLITDVDGLTDGQWAIATQVSTTNDDPLDPMAVWAAYTDLDVGDINCRAFRFRTLLWSYFATVTPSIEHLSVTIDMPDVIQGGNDILSLSSGDLQVNFPYVFRGATPELAFNHQNLQTGDYPVVTNKTASGFKISYRNAAGIRVIRSFDYHAKSYGILS